MNRGAPVVACIGECMIELRPQGPDLFRQAFAGDVYNSAVYLKRSLPQADVRFITVTGDDRQSARMREAWAAEGVDGDHAFVAPGSPGLYMIELDERGERSFSYWRSASPARSWVQRMEAAGGADILAGADLVHLSSISLAILTPEDRDLALDLLAQLRGRIGRVSFDPNYRPALWPSPRVARDTIIAAANLADIVLPSEEDMAALSLELTGDELVETLGANGCRVTYRGAVTTIAAPEIVAQPLDTSGAGDSFNGAYLAARLQGETPENAARLALAVASRVVQAPGAVVTKEQSHGA